MLVEITQDDINKAKEARRKFEKRETWAYCRAGSCPLAFALKRVFSTPLVNISEVAIYVDYKRLCKNPDSVKAFIREADKKRDKIRPRKLEIPIE